jgi:hypothetical protein
MSFANSSEAAEGKALEFLRHSSLQILIRSPSCDAQRS